VVDRLIDEGTSFEVVIDEVSKSSQVYHTLQLQESAKEQEQKSKKEPKAQKEKREQSAPKEKRELSDGLQVRHVWKGHTWEGHMDGGLISNGVENFKTFSEFARKHKLFLGQDTTANGVAECEWFKERTQKWVKGMYAESDE
jgi:phage protein D